MEIIECVNTMWGVFSRSIGIKDDKDIQTFIEAKDRIHQLIAETEKEGFYQERVYD